MIRTPAFGRAATVALIAISALAMGIPVADPARAVPTDVDPTTLTATPLAVDSVVDSAKSDSGRLAETDPTLLGRTDAEPVRVVVKLDYDSTAAYDGDVEGLAATSPEVTGQPLTGSSPAEVAYEAYTGQIDAVFRADLAAEVPAADAGQSLQRVYGGVAVTVPANEVEALLALPNVAAVQVDELNTLHTDSSNTFIGSPTLWSQLGGQALAGQGVIFGDLDSGVWPEHPSFADNPALGAPPAKADGTPRACEFGDNPLTAAVDVFACNSKLIGGDTFLDTYNAVQGGEVFPNTARDSNGHGTHTASTAAGNALASAPLFGVERGPISGVAPGAWLIEYKVCGALGCYGSDTSAAVAQAILDGVDVINYSISGGSNPYADVTELAFLDAYQAGILVSASAGNAGPGASTVDHVSPWVVTVAASTQTRTFQSNLTLTSGTDTLNVVGVSIGTGVSGDAPVVLAQSIPGADAACLTPLAPGSAAGMIVACQRTAGRVTKGFNVMQGGAVGMILYNASPLDLMTDNHWIPTVHIDGADFLAFMTAHGNAATGSFTAGVAADGTGDAMTTFSSRGPRGRYIKPDIAAPGLQILAGNTPVREDPVGGPPDEMFQAIAGTSMAAPHVAGAAILIKALHPDWTPGMIKSALMTTAVTSMVKQDLVTPADPFDRGAGRVDLNTAGAAPVVFDETSQRLFDLGDDPLQAQNLNLPSVNVPTMPGTVVVTRTAHNVSGSTYNFNVSTTAPSGSKIIVFPSRGTIKAGESRTFHITITSNAPSAQYFGEIRLTSSRNPAVHLPVAFFNQQGNVTLEQACADPSVVKGQSTTCTVTATNQSFDDTNVNIGTLVNNKLRITGATGASVVGGVFASPGELTLAGKQDDLPSIAAGQLAGFIPLELFGITPSAIGDESALNFNTPAFVFGQRSLSRIGVTSNGYIVLGGADGSEDIRFEPQAFPDLARPNGVLAPYWTDLDGATAPGVSIGLLTDGVNDWIVVEWNLKLYGTNDVRRFQAWIGIGTVEDITYAYDTTALNTGVPAGFVLGYGVENLSGTGGVLVSGPPATDQRVTTAPGSPGGSVSYTMTVRGEKKGAGKVTTSMVSDLVNGLTTVSTTIDVLKP